MTIDTDSREDIHIWHELPGVGDIDPWDEMQKGHADQAGVAIYRLYCGVRRHDPKVICSTLKRIIELEEWRSWRWIGREFTCSSFYECLTRHPPKGVGANIPFLRRLIQDDKEALDLLDETLRREVGINQWSEPKGVASSTIRRPDGNSIENALRRLRSDPRTLAKELHAKVLAGELSPHRAAVLAGYRKELTLLERVLRLLPNLTPDETTAVIEAATKQLDQINKRR
jgi:hypothetical protein